MWTTQQFGIKSGLSYIIGYPGESEESMYETIYEAAEMKTKFPSCSVDVFPYRPIPGSEFWRASVEEDGYPVPETFEEWGRCFDYKFNSWWGTISPPVQNVWARFTMMAPWFDGLAGGNGPLSRTLRQTAGMRLRHRIWAAPIEFRMFDVFRRGLGSLSNFI